MNSMWHNHPFDDVLSERQSDEIDYGSLLGRAVKTVIFGWAVMALGTAAFWGFVIWAIVTLVNRFT